MKLEFQVIVLSVTYRLARQLKRFSATERNGSLYVNECLVFLITEGVDTLIAAECFDVCYSMCITLTFSSKGFNF